MKVAAKVDDQQTVFALAEVTQQEGFIAEHSAVNTARQLRAEARVGAPQLQQVFVQPVDLGVALALSEVQLTFLEGLDGAWIIKHGLRFGRGVAAKLLDEFSAAIAHQLGQLRLMIGEIKEGRRGRELLPHKQHRRAGREQHERRHRAVAARTRQKVGARARRRVSDLVVILNEGDERRRLHIEAGRAAPLLLPLVPLALIEVAILDG